MKRLLLALTLGAAFTLASPSAVIAQQPQPDPTLELRAQLAEANLTIAQLKRQISELNISLVIAQRAVIPSIDQVRDESSRNLTAAVEAASAARQAAIAGQAKQPAPSSKK